LIKIFIGIFFIVVIGIYHNRKLSNINKKLFKLQNELLEQAHRDPLTGLYNRRYFHHIASSIAKISLRSHQNTGIIILDIDHFKSINDTYGHLIGDDIIKHLSLLLLNLVRVSDIVSRFGGDEFIILLPNTNIEESIKIAEKIRTFISCNVFNLDQNNAIEFTISLGVDEVLESDEDIINSLNRADKALYKAKNNGRNGVEYN